MSGNHPALIILIVLTVLISGCNHRHGGYGTFADYPGFEEYFGRVCSAAPASAHDRELLARYRPRIYLPPGSQYPIDFYRDYLPLTTLHRLDDGSIVSENVSPKVLKEHQYDKGVYLDFQPDRSTRSRKMIAGGEDKANAGEHLVYGRAYRERVSFPCEKEENCFLNLIFLKYSIVFEVSGLPLDLPTGYETFLRLLGLNPGDWHELDNFVSVHIVLDEGERPVAVLLAQHNHHRTYLFGKDIPFPEDGRAAFDIARRSNELYPASVSEQPVKHRAVQRGLYIKYVLSGEDPPVVRGYDITYGKNAGGMELEYGLSFLRPCDPFYTARIMLGEPRPFFGKYIGRDGPPGADYYALPELIPLGNLLKFSYLRDGNREDISMLDRAMNRDESTVDIGMIMRHGGANLYRALMENRHR